MTETNADREGPTAQQHTDATDAQETPQSGLRILQNLALYILVPVAVLLLIKFLTG